MNKVNIILHIVIASKNSFIVKEKDHQFIVKLSGIINTIIKANAHLRLHQANKCCQLEGICSSVFVRFNHIIGP